MVAAWNLAAFAELEEGPDVVLALLLCLGIDLALRRALDVIRPDAESSESSERAQCGPAQG